MKGCARYALVAGIIAAASGIAAPVTRADETCLSPYTAALVKGDDPQWLYTVLFDGRELWGENSDPTLKVSIDAFEPYLEPA